MAKPTHRATMKHASLLNQLLAQRPDYRSVLPWLLLLQISLLGACNLTHFRNTLPRMKLGSIEIRQLYPAGAYHLIVEGLARGKPPDTTLPVCLIYPIEDQHIIRRYAW